MLMAESVALARIVHITEGMSSADLPLGLDQDHVEATAERIRVTAHSIFVPGVGIPLDGIDWAHLPHRFGRLRNHPACVPCRAAGVGFEPTVGCPTAVFKTAALGH